jgi:hypothetical protein
LKYLKNVKKHVKSVSVIKCVLLTNVTKCQLGCGLGCGLSCGIENLPLKLLKCGSDRDIDDIVIIIEIGVRCGSDKYIKYNNAKAGKLSLFLRF